MLEIVSGALTLTTQDGLAHGPSFMARTWPKKLREEYLSNWKQQHPHGAEKQTPGESTTFQAPPGYSESADHLWNFFQAVRTRRPVVEDATFGNHTAIACHMANYSYFNKKVAIWDGRENQIKG